MDKITVVKYSYAGEKFEILVKPDPAFDYVYKGKTFTQPVNFGRENGKHFSAQSKMGRQWGR